MAKATASAERSSRRVNFARIRSVIDIPNLIEVQQKSYRNFLQYEVPARERQDVGLESIFRNVFPINDFNEVASLEYVGYEIGIWECDCGEYRGLGAQGVACERCGKLVRYKERFDVDECRQRGMTYADPLRAVVQLVVSERDDETGTRSIRDVKEQKVYLGEMPLMTSKGTFIINGTERVIVSQMHRSPGAFFTHDKGKSHSSGKVLYSARLIPYRGSWIDFEFDIKDVLHVRIDRRRKMPATVLLRALGYTVEGILNAFYPIEEIVQLVTKNEFYRPLTELLVGQKASADIRDKKTDEVVAREGRKITRGAFKRLVQSGVRTVPIAPEGLIGRIAARDIVDKKTGEVLVEINTEVTAEQVEAIKQRRIDKIPLLFIDEHRYDSSLRDTLAGDRVTTQHEALVEIYKRLRPGDTPTKETAKTLFENMFFNAKRYDLSKIGRLKLNAKLGSNYPLQHRLLKRDDVVAAMRYLLDLRHGIGNIDDIDHLGNRRVRSVGELLENQLRVALVKMERAIRERMSIQSLEAAMPHDLINSKPITAAIKEFFGSSQLSQFMDQTNPLSEITHKRRLSALGPGGLTRERAGFEVRDVHPTHYGRICPVETPEGPNIGLIASLSTYGCVNDFGFIETPYRKVANGRVTDQVEFLSAIEEDRYVIAQANAALDANGRFVQELVSARRGGEFILSSPENVDYMDVSPKQLVSVVASLIPFLENDDANRALMGSNMQRQAVPLLRTEAPLVGTGMEEIAAHDSGAVVVARNDGVVVSVDATRTVVRADGDKGNGAGARVDIYNLTKYRRSNQSTCINQKPILKEGKRVRRGQVIADGPATDSGELALGRNLLVAFMPWGGYNFEDAIVISEKVVKEDIFTSIHIQEFEVEARDTKQGKEEITRDIPNVGEEALKDLDECGIIRIGAKVKPGDILVGKVTPKGETQLSPEEKLLKAIFGEKGGDVRDSSLVVPPGVEGTVIDVKVFSRRSEEKDARAKAIEQEEIERLEKDFHDQVRIFKEERDKQVREIMVGLQSLRNVKDEEGNVLVPSRKPMTPEMMERVEGDELLGIHLMKAAPAKENIREVVERTGQEIHNLSVRLKDKIAKTLRGDDLPPGVIKMVKVFISMKRKFSVGDKMAGRHGNKGVVSIIVPEEDMPYLPDGTPVELILNPLGVPSRMNVGQILETHLGWAASKLGVRYATPVFDGATESDIKEQLERAELPPSGRTFLYDGRTGLPFDQQVAVGYIYMMKLHHLVDDKIHARSTGPYSLVTQQPLGGKAQFGGQRLGEMEVWALEAYGAARTLQEMLTVKSDDLVGRTKMYEAIVKGENTLEANLPESFNVLMLELRSLGLDVELISGDGEKRTPSDGKSGGGRRRG